MRLGGYGGSDLSRRSSDRQHDVYLNGDREIDSAILISNAKPSDRFGER